jgi:uncharacterized short protein YbdD (DUF466 family)
MAAFSMKPGQPDLPTWEQVKHYLANDFDSGIADYDKVIENMRAKGFQNSMMILRTHNL